MSGDDSPSEPWASSDDRTGSDPPAQPDTRTPTPVIGVDVRTVERVTVDDELRVAVGELRGRDGYEAAVVETRASPVTAAMSALLGTHDDAPEWVSCTDAPRQRATSRWTAVGKAVDGYHASLTDDQQTRSPTPAADAAGDDDTTDKL